MSETPSLRNKAIAATAAASILIGGGAKIANNSEWAESPLPPSAPLAQSLQPDLPPAPAAEALAPTVVAPTAPAETVTETPEAPAPIVAPVQAEAPITPPAPNTGEVVLSPALSVSNEVLGAVVDSAAGLPPQTEQSLPQIGTAFPGSEAVDPTAGYPPYEDEGQPTRPIINEPPLPPMETLPATVQQEMEAALADFAKPNHTKQIVHGLIKIWSAKENDYKAVENPNITFTNGSGAVLIYANQGQPVAAHLPVEQITIYAPVGTTVENWSYDFLTGAPTFQADETQQSYGSFSVNGSQPFGKLLTEAPLKPEGVPFHFTYEGDSSGKGPFPVEGPAPSTDTKG